MCMVPTLIMILLRALMDQYSIFDGYLNFTLYLRELWGPRSRMDPHHQSFTNFLIKNQLLDLELINLSPTWMNGRSNGNYVLKHLDILLLFEYPMSFDLSFKSIADIGGIYDHRPILLHFTHHGGSNLIPFIF